MNDAKIAGPTVLGRIPPNELDELMRGYGYEPFYVEGSDPLIMHQKMAATMDTVITKIRKIQDDARKNGFKERPQWPMIVLRSPKGWTGPHVVDGQQIEGTFRAHQVPVSEVKTNPAHLKILNEWLLSYKPHELFDETGRLIPELAELAPKGLRRMGANPHANGGILLRELRMPDFRKYAVDVPSPGVVVAESTRVQGNMIRDVFVLNEEAKNFPRVQPG